MIIVTPNDAHVAHHASEMVEDHYETDGARDHTPEDRESARRLGKLGRGLLVTGDPFTVDEGVTLLKEVVTSELDHWIPGASQRLINRASLILVGSPILGAATEADHGPNPADHALLQDWVAGIFVLRCVTCAHLFKV
jgi:hypothetical protein